MNKRRIAAMLLALCMTAQPVTATTGSNSSPPVNETTSSSKVEEIPSDPEISEIPSDQGNSNNQEIPAIPAEPAESPKQEIPAIPVTPPVMDSGVGPYEGLPIPPGISNEDNQSPKWLSDEETEEPDYNCWFGCTHSKDQDHWFPEVDIIYPDLSELTIPGGKGRASSVVDLTDSATGGAASLACIWVSGYDTSTHYQSCLNHSGSGTWNGVAHSGGRRNIQAHTMSPMPVGNCDDTSIVPSSTCTNSCGYSKIGKRPAHTSNATPSNPWPDFDGASHYTHCTVCTRWLITDPCYINGQPLTIDGARRCPWRSPIVGTCQHGAYYDSKLHYYHTWNGMLRGCCNQNVGLTAQPVQLTYNADGSMTWSRTWTATPNIVFSIVDDWDLTRTSESYTTSHSLNGNNITVNYHIIPRKNMTVHIRGGFAFYQKSIGANLGEVTDIWYIPTNEKPQITSATTTATGSAVGGFAGGRTLNVTANYNFDDNIELALFKPDGTTLVSPWTKVTKSGGKFNWSVALNTTSNGETYVLKARDVWGNESQTSVTIPKTDSVAPTLTTPPDMTSTWRKSQDVTFRASDNGGVGQVQIAFNQESDYQLGTASGSEYTRSYTFTGDVYSQQTRPLYLKDALGNAKQYSINLNRLDNTKPTVTSGAVDYNSNKTNATITAGGNDNHATLGAGSGISQWAISTSNSAPASGWQSGTSFTITENATYYVWAKDVAGNVSVARTVAVTGIDKVAPLVNSAAASTVWATSNTVTIAGTDENSGVSGYALTTSNSAPGSGWQSSTSFTVTNNGVYYAWLKDNAGNVSVGRAVTVSKVDRDSPALTGAAVTPSGWNSANKTITVTGSDTGSGIKEYRLAKSGGATVTNTSGVFSVTVGSYTASIVDQAENVSNTQVVLVDKIDLGPPTVQSVIASAVWARENTVTINATDAESGIKEYALSTSSGVPSSGWQSSNVFTVTSNQVYYVWVRDNVGNVTKGTTVTVSRVDRDNPVVTSVVSAGDWNTSNMITATATDSTSSVASYALTNSNITPTSGWQTTGMFTVTSNGDYWVWVKDQAGNVSTSTKVSVSKVDRENPVISNAVVERADEWTPGDKILKVTGSDVGSGIKEYFAVHPDGTRIANTTGVFSLKMGVWTIGMTDKVNNQSITQTVAIAKIDLNKPVIKTTDTNTKWAQENTITVDAEDTESGISGYALTADTAAPNSGWQPEAKFTVIVNGDYWVWVRDNVGNVSLGTKVTVNKVDRVIPTVTAGSTNPIKVKDTDITVSASDTTGLASDPTGTVMEYALTETDKAPASGWQASPVFKVTEQKEYWLWAKDHAGNVSMGFKYRPTQMWYTFHVGWVSEGSAGKVPQSGLSGEVMEVIPNPAIGYALDKTSVKLNGETLSDLDPSKDGYQFKMPEEDSTMSWKFYPVVYQVSITPSKDGTVTADRKTATVEDEVTLTITPDTGRHLVKDQLRYNGLIVPGVVYDGYNETKAKFRMLPSDVEVTAEFGTTIYTNTDGCDPTQGSIKFDHDTAALNDKIQVYPTTEPGWRMVPGSLRANGRMIFNNEFIMPPEDVVVKASFVQVAYGIKAAEQEGGRVTVSRDEALWLQTIDVSAVANPGWKLDPDGYKVNGKKIIGSSFRVTGDSVVSATFVGLPQKLSVKVNGSGGTATVDKTDWNTGEQVEVTITPHQGWLVGQMWLNGKECTSEFKMPATDSEFVVEFVPVEVMGTVKDTTGKPIAQAQLRITNSKDRKIIYSGDTGNWIAGRLNDGEYTISASHYKYNSSSVKITIKDRKASDKSKLDIILDRDAEVERVEDLIDNLTPESTPEDIFDVKKEYDELDNKSQVDKDKLDKLDELLKKIVDLNARVESNIKDTEADDLQNSVNLAGVKLDPGKLKSNVEFILSVEETSTPAAMDKWEINEFYDKSKKLGMFLNIDLLVKVDENPAYKVHEADAPIKVKMPVPEDAIGSEYRIVRVHNGVTQYLTTSVQDGMIQFATDRFSTYAIEFKPGEEIIGDEIPGDEPNKGEGEDGDPENPGGGNKPDTPSKPNQPDNGSTGITGGSNKGDGNKSNSGNGNSGSGSGNGDRWNKPIEITPGLGEGSGATSGETSEVPSEIPETPTDGKAETDAIGDEGDQGAGNHANSNNSNSSNQAENNDTHTGNDSKDKNKESVSEAEAARKLKLQRTITVIVVSAGVAAVGGLAFWIVLIIPRRKKKQEELELDKEEEDDDWDRHNK